MRDSGKKDGAVGVISGSERRSVKVMCLLISCFMKMGKFFLSLSQTCTHMGTHCKRQSGGCLFARQTDNIQSAKQFICKIFLCRVYRRKVKQLIRYFSSWPDDLFLVLLRSNPALFNGFSDLPSLLDESALPTPGVWNFVLTPLMRLHYLL